MTRFGPVGVSALSYLALGIDDGATDPRPVAAGTLAVATHTVVFGLTAAPARELYSTSRAADPLGSSC